MSALDSITVSGPTKTEYKIGAELDLAGLEVTAHYSDGSEVAVEEYEVSGFDSSTAGEKTVTVTYEGKIAAFTVNVLPDDDTDKTDLEIAVELAGLLDLNRYTEESVQVFRVALASAQAVFSNETLSVDDQKPDNNNQNQNDGANDANSVNKPVQTGDTTPVGAMLLLVIVSGAAAAAVIVRRKHR